jgi:hypothetical protein
MKVFFSRPVAVVFVLSLLPIVSSSGPAYGFMTESFSVPGPSSSAAVGKPDMRRISEAQCNATCVYRDSQSMIYSATSDRGCEAACTLAKKFCSNGGNDGCLQTACTVGRCE